MPHRGRQRSAADTLPLQIAVYVERTDFTTAGKDRVGGLTCGDDTDQTAIERGDEDRLPGRGSGQPGAPASLVFLVQSELHLSGRDVTIRLAPHLDVKFCNRGSVCNDRVTNFDCHRVNSP